MSTTILNVGDALHESAMHPTRGDWAVRRVSTAAECLAILDAERFDLVLIAPTLPDASALALRERLLERSDLAAVPVLVVQGAASPATAPARSSAAGAVAANAAFIDDPERFRALVEHGEEMIGVYSPDGNRYISPAVERVLGYRVEEYLAFQPGDLIHPDDLPSLKVTGASLFANPGSVTRSELRMRAKDGTWRHVESIASSRIGDPAVRGIVSHIRDISERKRQEDALRESRRMLEAAEAMAHLGSWRSGPGGGYPFVWSMETYRLFGIEPGTEVTQEVFAAGIHPDDVDRIQRATSAPQTDGQVTEGEHRIVRADGAVRWVRVLMTAECDSAGRLVQFTGTTQDVTERRVAELARDAAFERERAAHAAASASRDSIADILDSITDGFFTLDRQQRVRYFNHAMEALTGRRADTMIGRVVWEELPMLAADPVVQETLEHPPGTCEIHDEPNNRRFNLRAYPTKDGAAIYLRDETARRQAEHERDRFFELSHDLLTIAGVDGELRRTSQSWSRATGFAPEELHRMRITDRVHPDDVELTTRAFAQLRTEVPVVSWENRIRCKDGSFRSIEWTSVPAPSEGLAYTVGRDVTTHKQLEAQLRQAQKMEAIGRLAGGVAHDFNNMLTVILGVGQILRQEVNAGDPLRADVDEIIVAAERAALLTRQLLAFSRKQVLKPRATDLTSLVRDMDGMLRRLIGEDIDMQLVLASQAGPVLADPGQLEQVILNLVVNARDAMPNGGRLTLETRSVLIDKSYADSHLGLAPGAYALLLVSDNGEGMTPEIRERIFEPFFTTKETGRGTGLGLSTVHGIIAQSDGHIWVYSEPGIGTTFKIYLPLREGASTLAPPTPTLIGGGTGETVLLVEDEPLVRQFTRRALTRAGYRVIEAANGGEALLIVESHEGKIDLLLTDVVMPRMSGPALAERLKRARPSLRTLFMSGYSQSALGDGSVLPAGIDLIEKPVTLESLARKIREVLDR